MDGPKHNKAKKYFSSGLFDQLKDFSELERRIELLDSNKDKGDAFEVFAEAYINLNPILMAKEVWPFESIPIKIKKKLRIDIDRDKGIDGLFVDKLGRYCSYQVKYRSNRAALRWKEISTFLGLSEGIERKLVLCNSMELPADILNQRSDVFSIRGYDLDNYINQAFFKSMSDWLDQSTIKKDRKNPLPHQTKAVNNIVKELSSSDRTTAVMACGTGKSLVSLWVAEALNSKTTLVLVPSLALVRQLLLEWCAETAWEKFSYLCVCSDKTVAEDVLDSSDHAIDFNFPVSTDASDIVEFLESSSYRKVIFSTYHSAKTVSLGIPVKHSFDLCIFDEAHKTAGREGKKFGFALDEKNLRIKKRVFLTATPKHVLVRTKSSDEGVQAYSMNDETIYGRVSHRLSFYEAAKKGFICNYQVVVSVITKDDVSRELLDRGAVQIEEDEVKARQVANQLAIKECIDKYKVKKIFSFHKSIKSAKSFVALDNQGIGNHIDFLSTYHVNGRIQAGRREKIIREFKSSDYALLSNARCLTEGVDVPAVDMVAFMSPKRSRVDVIQATGRAMRKSGSKEVGYVLVPIYLELQTGESISDAINETDFGEVFDVLNALQEQDQELHNAICYLREQMPLAKGFRDDRFERRVKMISKSLKLDDLKASITTKIVRKLAPVWHERFAQLKNYYEEHGNSNVPSTWEKDPRLSNWVKTQRQQYQLGILTEDKIKKLESIDFSWSIVQFAWNENYKKLKDYFISFGNSAIKKDYDESLYNWVCTQRKNNEDGLLSDLKVELLNELDFSWERSTAGKDWDSRFEEVKQFFDSTGGFPNAREPIIGMWCVFQREKFRSGDLSVYKINKLDSIEFNWEPRQDNWDAKYKELCVFQKKYGHTRVSPRSSEYKKLSAWVISQRQKYPTYLESDNQKIIERVNLLNNIGFDWRTRSVEEEDNRFLEMLDQLQLFYTKHGHFHVPVGDQAYTDLGIWLRNQKSYHRRGNLVDYKKELMEEIGFSFERNEVLPEEQQADHGKKKQIGKPRTNKEKRTVEHVSDFRQEIFKNSFEKLVAYKARFGHTRVPARWEEDVPLGRWVERQRILFRKNKLPEIHQQMLDEIEFNYNVRESRKAKSASQKYSFDERLSQVENYKARFGTANVPIRCGQQGLGQWISRQRKKYKKGTLPQAEQQQLASLGVKFGENWYSEQGTEQLETTERKSAFSDWLLRYAELQDFYLKFGHSNVTLNHSADKSLHYWVRRQRLHYSQGRLSDEQIQQLESLNFAFRLRPEFVSWDQRVEQLEAFKAKFGHVEVTREQDHDEGLAKWLKSQVSRGRLGKIDERRKIVLQGLGVDFQSAKGISWEERYDQLCEFYKRNGHVDVPQRYGGTTGLGKWVNRMRQKHVAGTLSEERKIKLDKLGFIWAKKRGEQPIPMNE